MNLLDVVKGMRMGQTITWRHDRTHEFSLCLGELVTGDPVWSWRKLCDNWEEPGTAEEAAAALEKFLKGR